MDFNQMFQSLGKYAIEMKDFFFDRQFLNLFIATVVLIAASYFAWHIYSNQLAKRDLFRKRMRIGKTSYHFFDHVIYLLKYLIVFPIYSFLWFLIFAFLLFMLSKSRPIDDILYFGIVMVAATRCCAYINEKLAEDMAKLLPWSLIFVFLIDPQAISVNSIIDSFLVFMDYIPKALKYMLFIIVLEWVLRIGYWIIKPNEFEKAEQKESL